MAERNIDMINIGMSRPDYMEFHKSMCQRMIETTAKKNADYCGASDDPFANFEQAKNFLQLPLVTQIGFFTRMTDKFSRIGSFITKGILEVEDETVEDTLIDLANYCILFAGYLRSQKLVGDKNGTRINRPDQRDSGQPTRIIGWREPEPTI